MNAFTIEIVHYFDTENVIAEIYYNNIQLAEIVYKNKNFLLKCYVHPNNQNWEFSYEELMQTLEQAQYKLMSSMHKANLIHMQFTQTSEQINIRAQVLLEKILTHPEKKSIPGELKKLGKIIDIYAPDLGGVRYSVDGTFIGFLET